MSQPIRPPKLPLERLSPDNDGAPVCVKPLSTAAREPVQDHLFDVLAPYASRDVENLVFVGGGAVRNRADHRCVDPTLPRNIAAQFMGWQ